MIFPFEITINYKLPPSEFEKYSSKEIIDNLYKALLKEKYKWINKENGIIRFAGDKQRWHYIFLLPVSLTHCVDKGTIELIEKDKNRKLKYKYRIIKIFFYYLITGLLGTLLSWFLFKSKDITRMFFYISLSISVIVWLLSVLFHPITISGEIEKMRYQNIRERINKKEKN
jgi:hypothetical protein